MKFKARTCEMIAKMICGDFPRESSHFRYRSSSYITQFFEDCDTHYRHDGTTRAWWVAERLKEILHESQDNPNLPPPTFRRVIQTLMDRGDALNEGIERSGAIAALNVELAREGLEAFYSADGNCYLRHSATNTVGSHSSNPHRPLSKDEIQKRLVLSTYLDRSSEDELIEDVLLPLFRRLGFKRITKAGHKDKSLEYGKDIWMKFTLPTLHNLYFGIQAKRDKLDAAGSTKNANVAEVLNQIRMMLGHKLFDPEINKRVLVDHAIIVSGGEITKQARNWLGENLDESARSQILFMDRDDILDLYVVNGIELPSSVHKKDEEMEGGIENFPF